MRWRLNEMNEQKVLIQHIRDKDRKPFGTIVALDASTIAFSLCSPRDKFTKKRGIEIALGRAKSGRNLRMLPRWLFKLNETREKYVLYGEFCRCLTEMKVRAVWYFKEQKSDEP